MILALKRLLAYWLDFVILAICLTTPQWIIYVITSGFPFSKFNTGIEIGLWVIFTISIPVWIYFILFEHLKQQTIGKRILKLVVTNEEGCNISIKQAFIRTFIRLLPWELTHIIILIPEPWWSIKEPKNSFLLYIPNFIMLLFIVILMSNKGVKGLHDYITNTRVTINTSETL